MTLIEEIKLPNGLVAEIWDGSRMIAADTTTVVLVVKIPVILKEEYFEDPAACRKTAKVFGSPIEYEYRNERTFVHVGEREGLVQRIPGQLQERTFCPTCRRINFRDVSPCRNTKKY